jgi:hypothetical protein
MMRESYSDRHHHPPVLESMEIVVALVLMAVCWFSWYARASGTTSPTAN